MVDKFYKQPLSIQKLRTLDMLGTLSIIAGTIVSNNPEIIQSLVINKIGINDFYINFSKDQEREADHYAIETLNKLALAPPLGNPLDMKSVALNPFILLISLYSTNYFLEINTSTNCNKIKLNVVN